MRKLTIGQREAEAWRIVAEEFGPDHQLSHYDGGMMSHRSGICSALDVLACSFPILWNRMKDRLRAYHPDPYSYIHEFGSYRNPDSRAMACLWFACEAEAGIPPRG